MKNQKLSKQETSKIFSEIFNLSEKYYPFKSKGDFLIFKKRLNKVISKNQEKITYDDFFIKLKEAIAGIRHSHFRLDGYPWKLYKPADYNIKLIENNFFLFKNEKIIGQILKINKKNPDTLLKEKIRLMSGSTNRYLTSQALKFLLVDKTDKPAEIKIKDRQNIKNLNLKRSLLSNNSKEENFKFKKYKNGISYVKIKSWVFNNDFKSKIEKLIQTINQEKIKFLIIDVRGNQGGDSRACDLLTSHFFNKEVLFGESKRRLSQNNFKFKKHPYYLKPKLPYIDIPIVILTDIECFSSTELFIVGMKDNKRATLIGEPTGGGTGNPIKIDLKIKGEIHNLYIPTWIYYRKNGKLIEGKGINPDIKIKSTIEDFKKETDKALEEALKESFLP